MNIVYSSDDNYIRHVGASVYSLLEHNTHEDDITIYLLNVSLSEDSISKIRQITDKFSRKLSVVDFSNISKRLRMDAPVNSFTIEMYTRLFLPDALPDSEDRALYIDGDTTVLGSLSDLYYCDMENCYAAAVNDQPSFSLQISRDDADIKDGPYFASGMFLANLKLMRTDNIVKGFIDYLVETQGKMIFVDQSILNHVLNGRIKKLPMKNHLITPSMFLPYSVMKKNWGSEIYTKEEYKDAKKNPSIVHYTVSRPWKKWCFHPYKKYYHAYLEKTPWRGAELEENGSLGDLAKRMTLSIWYKIKPQKD